jgi:hypothetical protein
MSEKYVNGLKKPDGYKNGSASSMRHKSEFVGIVGPGEEKSSLAERAEEVCSVSLTDLLTAQATKENYEEVLNLLTILARSAYAEFKYLIAKSHDESESPNFIQIESPFHEAEAIHKKLFELGITYGINHEKLTALFAERVAKGEVIPLGTDVTVIVDDGEGQPATGVSPINRGIEGGSILFNIAFIKTANYAAWHENAFPTPQEGDSDE